MPSFIAGASAGWRDGHHPESGSWALSTSTNALRFGLSRGYPMDETATHRIAHAAGRLALLLPPGSGPGQAVARGCLASKGHASEVRLASRHGSVFNEARTLPRVQPLDSGS